MAVYIYHYSCFIDTFFLVPLLYTCPCGWQFCNVVKKSRVKMRFHMSISSNILNSLSLCSPLCRRLSNHSQLLNYPRTIPKLAINYFFWQKKKTTQKIIDSKQLIYHICFFINNTLLLPSMILSMKLSRKRRRQRRRRKPKTHICVNNLTLCNNHHNLCFFFGSNVTVTGTLQICVFSSDLLCERRSK